MTPYAQLPLIPSIIAETVCSMEYKGIEYTIGLRNTTQTAEIETLRQKMTPEQIKDFAEYVDSRCKKAYDAKVQWFLKIAKAKNNSGRDQLYVWVSHWLAAYLKTNGKKI